MKILILQLARFGDILLTLPAIQAVKRHRPDCSIDVMIRGRFQEAVSNANSIDNIKVFPSEQVIGPLLTQAKNTDVALEVLAGFIEEIRSENYDVVYNLTYSPLSSYLCHAITQNTETVCYGYTRHSDGFLAIPDEVSSYFYAQVGIKKYNRFHVSELFAMTLGVDLLPSDWEKAWQTQELRESLADQVKGKYFVVHPGASCDSKTLSANKWGEVVAAMTQSLTETIVLIGSPSDFQKSNRIVEVASAGHRLINLVGQTSFSDLFPILKGATIFIGGDSAPMHVSSFVQTPTLNLSFDTVNFWETGPKADGSVVLPLSSEGELPPEFVVMSLRRMLGKQSIRGSHFSLAKRNEFYHGNPSRESTLQWDFVTWLYFGEPLEGVFPPDFYRGCEQLQSATKVAVEALLSTHDESEIQRVSGIIHSVDAVFEKTASLVPGLKPMVAWFQTEKLRIGPGTFSEVAQATLNVYHGLSNMLDQLVQYQTPAAVRSLG